MKLLSLTLQNLNSLKGIWYINFTDPAYEDSGIFAITGQTGSGKTTILDAICLALYGKTPRVDVSKTTNEVMSRGSFQCMAEVEIEIKGYLYRCNWSQHRSHKRSDGNLQDINHNISKIKYLGDNHGQIIESKASKTKKVIIDTIGMDFEQFTRSVLLAQGQFSKFLKAKSDDRASILEKITGTEIYAIISRRVYDRKRKNTQKLKELKATLEGIQLLSEAELQEIIVELKLQQKEQAKYKLDLNILHEKITWKHNLVKLNKDINECQAQLFIAKQKQNDFLVHAHRLDAAVKALEVESHYQKLENIHKYHHNLLQKQNEINKLLPIKQNSLADANTQLADAKSKLIAIEDTFNRQLPIINQIKTLDNEIINTKKCLDDIKKHEDQLYNKLKANQQQSIENQQQIKQSSKELQIINQFLTNHANFANLNNDRDKLFMCVPEIKNLLFSGIDLYEEKIKSTNNLQNFNNQRYTLEDKIHGLNHQISIEKNKIDQIDDNIQILLENKDIKIWRNQLIQITEYGYQLTTAEQQYHHLNQIFNNIHNLIDTKKNITGQIKAYNKQINQQKDILTKLNIELSNKQETQKLQQQVIKLEQYILELKDHDACPLCGSLEHPYLKDLNNSSHPLFDPTDNQIDKLHNLNIQIQSIQESIKYEQAQLTTIEKNLAINTTQQQENQDQQDTLNKKMNDLIATIKTFFELDQNLDNKSSNESNQINIKTIEKISDTIKTRKSHNTQEKYHYQSTIEQYEILNEQLNKAKNQYEQLCIELHKEDGQLNQLITQEKLCNQELNNTEQKISDNFCKLESKTQNLKNILHTHQLALPNKLLLSLKNKQILNKEQIEEVLQELRNMASSWVTNYKNFIKKTEEKNSLDKLISNLNTMQVELKKQDTTLTQEFEQITSDINHQEMLYQQQLDVRKQLYSDKDPNTEEQQLHETLKSAQKTSTEMQTIQHDLHYQVSGLTKDLSTLVVDINYYQKELNKYLNIFNDQLKQNGFENKQNFLAARLSQSERQQLKEQKNSINTEVERLQTLLDNNQSLLKEQISKNLTDKSLEELIAQQSDTENKTHTLANKIGANQQKLQANKEQTAKSTEKQRAIDRQLQENETWEQLNTLIGSSDGKKFRIFAQGLTFESMIKNANQQLKKMSDRYLLIRDDAELLDLNVIDNYQAGEIRSCKNLSGGESFIISLSLALGLSQMASQNIRVDSLFLDEGFGTLDEDSLDIALDTLSSLQQEGKLIGIISHVQALKDRIHTQIKVEKISGGNSRLIGSGINQL